MISKDGTCAFGISLNNTSIYTCICVFISIIDRNSCIATLCENGGACVANATGTFCECGRGYGGSLCQRGISY